MDQREFVFIVGGHGDNQLTIRLSATGPHNLDALATELERSLTDSAPAEQLRALFDAHSPRTTPVYVESMIGVPFGPAGTGRYTLTVIGAIIAGSQIPAVSSRVDSIIQPLLQQAIAIAHTTNEEP